MYCHHNNKYVKYFLIENDVVPKLICSQCYIKFEDYSPAFHKEVFTHDRIYGPDGLKNYLHLGTESEILGKINSLNFHLKSITEHFLWCTCGYDDNHEYIFKEFINQYKLLEYFAINRRDLAREEWIEGNFGAAFPQRLLNYLVKNKNEWTSKFMIKYFPGLVSTND